MNNEEKILMMLESIQKQITSLEKNTNDRFESMENKLETMEKNTNKKFAAVDERFNAVDERFNTVDERFNTVDERFNTIDERFDAMENFIVNEIQSTRDELKLEIQHVYDEVKELKEDFNNIEQVTAKNWLDISRLKSVR